MKQTQTEKGKMPREKPIKRLISKRDRRKVKQSLRERY